MTKGDIAFNVDGQKLRGRLYRPVGKAKRPAFLFLHGFTGKPNDRAAAIIAENGFYAMTFSLSGHNDSEGKIEDQSRGKSLKETLAAYNFFKSKLPLEVKIAAVGNSYGGYLAPLLSAEKEVGAISMRVPANYPDKGFDEPQIGRGHEDPRITRWRNQKLNSDGTKSLKALRDFIGSVQIIEAENDDAVPHQTVQNYVDAVSDKRQLDYRFMKGWPHSLGDHEERNKQFQELLLNWANKVTKKL